MKHKNGWMPIETAPRTGVPIEISGKRFMIARRYYATAVWARRECPAEVEDWFPPSDDGGGPFTDVDRWRPVQAV